MMNISELAKTRYTTKAYNPDQKIPDTVIEQLKEIIRLSPSSINSQPWKFTFVSDETIKRNLAAVSYFNEQKINDASHLVVFGAIDDIPHFEEQISKNLPEGAVNYYKQFIQTGTEAEIRSWMQHQVYLSLGFFLSAAAALEIDSTPMEGIKTDEYDAILQNPGYKTLFAVALGYRNPEDANQPVTKPKSRLPMEQVVHSL